MVALVLPMKAPAPSVPVEKSNKVLGDAMRGKLRALNMAARRLKYAGFPIQGTNLQGARPQVMVEPRAEAWMRVHGSGPVRRKTATGWTVTMLLDGCEVVWMEVQDA